MTSLPGYDGWKTGGGMPHLEDRNNPYLPDSGAAVCWYNGPECDGGLGGLKWDRDRLHLVCEKCRETEGHDDDAPCCWECGDHGAKAELVECRDRHWRCARCLAEVEATNDAD